jgi:hypothetical protein
MYKYNIYIMCVCVCVCVCVWGDFLKQFLFIAYQRLHAERKIQRYVQMCKLHSNNVNAYYYDE